MNNSILRFGIYAAILLIGIQLITLVIFGIPGPEDYKLGEIIGYSSIILSLLFVYFGIRYYRDEHAAGQISFWKAVKIGLGIAFIPSLAFAIYNFIYMEWLDPEFATKYMSYALEQAQTNMDASSFEAYKTNMEKNEALYMNSGFQSFLMFVTVFVIGLVISLVSSFILKKTSD